MADNIDITPGTGATVAADLVDGALYQRVKVAIGADGTAADWPVGAGDQSAVPRVTLASDSPGIVTPGTAAMAASISVVQASDYTGGYAVSASFTPAATSHTASDVVGGAQTFTAIGPASCMINIASATLEIDSASAQATAWRLHLYNVTPPSATADDGAWDLPSGDRASYLGFIDLGTAVDVGSTQWVETHNINKRVMMPVSGNLFGYLTNLTTLSLAAVVHKVTLHADRV